MSQRKNSPATRWISLFISVSFSYRKRIIKSLLLNLFSFFFYFDSLSLSFTFSFRRFSALCWWYFRLFLFHFVWWFFFRLKTPNVKHVSTTELDMIRGSNTLEIVISVWNIHPKMLLQKNHTHCIERWVNESKAQWRSQRYMEESFSFLLLLFAIWFTISSLFCPSLGISVSMSARLVFSSAHQRSSSWVIIHLPKTFTTHTQNTQTSTVYYMSISLQIHSLRLSRWIPAFFRWPFLFTLNRTSTFSASAMYMNCSLEYI